MYMYMFIFVISILECQACAQTGLQHDPARILGQAQLSDPQQNGPGHSKTGFSLLTQKAPTMRNFKETVNELGFMYLGYMRSKYTRSNNGKDGFMDFA